MSEKKWVLKEGKPRCGFCNSLLRPVDEPTGLKCESCGQVYPLSEEELAQLTFDLSD